MKAKLSKNSATNQHKPTRTREKCPTTRSWCWGGSWFKKTGLFYTLFLVSGAVLLFAQSPTAVIREMSGTVELKKSGSAVWVPAQQGDLIDKATIVSTGFKSTASLVVGNSTLIVRPLTRLSLEELMIQNETEMININLSTGRIHANVKPPAGGRANFSVQSPTATASVRGTSFEMDTSSIQVLEGAVSYAPAAGVVSVINRPVTISAGQESWVDTNTGKAVAPMIAAETSSSIPSLPGQSAGTIAETGTRSESPGSMTIGVGLGGQVVVEVELK